MEDLQEARGEEACLRWVEAYPLRLNVNAFYGVIAAIEGVDWRELDPGWRARARALRNRLSRGGEVLLGPRLASLEARSDEGPGDPSRIARGLRAASAPQAAPRSRA